MFKFLPLAVIIRKGFFFLPAYLKFLNDKCLLLSLSLPGLHHQLCLFKLPMAI